MDAILEFKVHAIMRDIDLKPSECDVENAIKKMICEYLGAERVEISELAVDMNGRTPEPWRGEDDERSDAVE